MTLSTSPVIASFPLKYCCSDAESAVASVALTQTKAWAKLTGVPGGSSLHTPLALPSSKPQPEAEEGGEYQ